MAIKRVKIIGSGLIGTSIALALAKSGSDVTMIDRSSNSAALAQALVGDRGTIKVHLI
jgi:3-hydroxyacyl-CoA dehydrogenase